MENKVKAEPVAWAVIADGCEELIDVMRLKPETESPYGISYEPLYYGPAEGYPGIAHDLEKMRSALVDLEQAALRMAQIVNRSFARKGEAALPTIAEWDKARQDVDQARAIARCALKLPMR